jgi:hypothetical protein
MENTSENSNDNNSNDNDNNSNDNLIHSRLRAQVYDRNEIGIKGFLVFV